MKRIWLHKANSFQSAEKFEGDYGLSTGSSERIVTMQFLSEQYFNLKKAKKNTGGKEVLLKVKYER